MIFHSLLFLVLKMVIVCVLVVVLEITIGEPLASLIVNLARSAGKDVDIYLVEVLSGKWILRRE